MPPLPVAFLIGAGGWIPTLPSVNTQQLRIEHTCPRSSQVSTFWVPFKLLPVGTGGEETPTTLTPQKGALGRPTA